MIKKKTLIIIISTFLIIMGFTIALAFLLQRPQITFSTPSNNQTGVDLKTREIRIGFNIPQENLAFSVSPNFSFSVRESANGKEIILTPKESLQNLSEYTIKVKLEDRLGKIRSEEIIRFKTKFVNYQDLPDDLKKKGMEATDICEEDKTNELCRH